MKHKILADGALILVSMSWGLNFVFTKDVLDRMGPYSYLGIRFVIAAALMAAIFWRQLKNLSREELRGGVILGLFMTLGFITQTVGLIYTTPAKSGFITGSNVVMVPLAAYLITKRFPGWAPIIGAVVTFWGIGVISLGEGFTVNIGDALTLMCAAFFALQIAYTEHFVKDANPVNIAIVQVAVTGLVCMPLAWAFEGISPNIHAKDWFAIAFAVIFCTAGAFAIQNLAQKYTASTHAAIILCTEAMFAGIFAHLILKEVMTTKTLWGFALIITGVLITEIAPLVLKDRRGVTGHISDQRSS